MTKYKLKKKIKVFLFIIFLIILITFFIILFPRVIKKDKSITTTTTTSTTTTKKTQEVKLTLVGDFLFEGPFYRAVDAGDDKDVYLRRINEKYFKNDDITIGNMEVPINTPGVPVKGDGYNFNAPLWAGELVANQSIEFLGTANNHTYDQGIEGLESTLNFLKSKNILTVGSFMNDDDRATHRIMEINDIKVGFLAYTMGTNIYIPDKHFNRVAHFRNPNTAEVTDYNKKLLRNEISALRENVDILIVLMHWGHEYTYTPTTQQREMAEFLNSLKVDIIVGAHSHCIQPIEWIGNEHKTLTFFSLGNFVSGDSEVIGASTRFDNAYQIGLISQIKITKNDNNITYDYIKANPIINYYDSNERNFELIPFDDYTDEYEQNHYRYNYGLTKSWIIEDFNEVISEEFR